MNASAATTNNVEEMSTLVGKLGKVTKDNHAIVDKLAEVIGDLAVSLDEMGIRKFKHGNLLFTSDYVSSNVGSYGCAFVVIQEDEYSPWGIDRVIECGDYWKTYYLHNDFSVTIHTASRKQVVEAAKAMPAFIEALITSLEAQKDDARKALSTLNKMIEVAKNSKTSAKFPETIYTTPDEWGGDEWRLTKDEMLKGIEKLKALGGEWKDISIDDCREYNFVVSCCGKAVYEADGGRLPSYIIAEHSQNVPGAFNFVSGEHDNRISAFADMVKGRTMDETAELDWTDIYPVINERGVIQGVIESEYIPNDAVLVNWENGKAVETDLDHGFDAILE